MSDYRSHPHHCQNNFVLPNDTVCINDGTFQLTASPTGGSWSGPGVNPATGVIDLNMAKGGVKMYNYVFEKGTSCEVSGSVNIK
ncbi:MAG: hypothetical protein IPP37_17445 [Saprospiraceae bacterium]|nr:hypothetical protein [Saprospiraceae bacterium]